MSRSFRKSPCIGSGFHPYRLLRKRVKEAIIHGDEIMPLAREAAVDYREGWNFYGRYTNPCQDSDWVFKIIQK